jgi:hypothetical protein
VSVASQLRELHQRYADAQRRLVELERRATDPRDLDETQLTQMLGEETARVLETARQAAGEIRAKAEEASVAEQGGGGQLRGCGPRGGRRLCRDHPG